MTGTVLDVDTAVYYDTAGKIAAGAQAWWAAIDARWPEIAKAVDMAGSYDDGHEWGKSYDTRAAEILKMVTRVASATHAYAIVLNNLGYQRALDEHGATIDAGPAPVKPTAPMYPVLNCRVPLPSAGGPGNGLVDEGLGLVAKIGITVPDGNATTISNAAVTWDAARTATEVAGFPAILEAAAIAFEAVAAPEVEFVDEDLRALKAAAAATLTAMGDLAQSCRDHRIALDELRELLKKQLEMVRDALIQELAITAAISVASSFITFGAGAAIGLAGAAAICARYARPMRLIIQEWRTNRGISAGVKLDADLARHVRECERLEDLGPAGRLKPKADPPPKPELIELGPIPHPPGIPKVELSQAERDAITKYTGNSYDINSALRSGNELTVAQRAEVEQLNTTLDKLPTFEGAVTRRTDLDADVLAKYERGAEVTEAAFTSSSATAKAAKDLPVEFQIWSETGRYVGHHSTAPQELEVLFKSGTPFRVVDRFEVDGRTIIQMREMPR
ncbi:ADP-ribosyltransferase [Nocardia altamirensis]|uniref:ADP-ribosyltransferase n=1 Tax=Nocardia altamirensis TaxID=472158 RepID=UPI0008405CFB|nr:ADP-ribosyltransferase [Nocardia altamirensis]